MHKVKVKAKVDAMGRFKTRFTSLLVLFAALIFSAGCGGGGGDGSGDGNSQNTTQSNMARFYFDCDLQGLTGKMVMDIEIIASSGVTWSAGSDPDITGVIETGDYTIYTEGELTSPTSSYIFSGENQYADFTEISTYERFRVQWVEETDGITMIVNPFGPGPTQHFCLLTDSELL